jgi:hypothetical protein
LSDTAILIPSLREHLWDDILKNVAETCDAKVLFLGEEYPSYATAVNAGWKQTEARYLMTSDDDTAYREGWLDKCLAEMGDGISVVGTNDLHNPFVLHGEHSTHSLFDRRYIEKVGATWDGGPGSFLHEGYDHNYTDSEAIEVARARKVFAPCLEAICEHRHFEWGMREQDGVTRRTRRRWHADWALFMERRQGWVDQLDIVHEYTEPPHDR